MSKFFMQSIINVDGVELAVSAVRYYYPAEPDVGIFTDEVEWSWVLPASAGTCDKLPAKYELVWVR